MQDELVRIWQREPKTVLLVWQGTSIVDLYWAGCIINMSGFDLRQAQPFNHGLRLHDRQGVQHLRSRTIQAGEYQAVQHPERPPFR
jgi:hypothetical protein